MPSASAPLHSHQAPHETTPGPLPQPQGKGEETRAPQCTSGDAAFTGQDALSGSKRAMPQAAEENKTLRSPGQSDLGKTSFGP